MLLADHLRLENVLNPIEEIESVTQSWAHGFDIVAVNLTCGNKEVKINAWKEITFPEDCE